MSPITAFHVACVAWFFMLGAVVGSFLNVCIYRLPWQKSLIWPDSRCPKCLESIAARDNIPVLSWFALRGECRRCGLPIPIRYALVEALVGVLFVGAYVADVGLGGTTLFAGASFAELAYHLILVALLVTATFTDYDLQVIPDAITLPGIAAGLALGTWFPWIRPVPATATSAWAGLWPAVAWAAVGGAIGWGIRLLVRTIFRGGAKSEESEEEFGLPTILAFVAWQAAVWRPGVVWGGLVVGLQGLLIGGALVWAFRVGGRAVFRKEAMGFGDITLLGMIGAFMGWEAAVLTFFLAPFFGLAHAFWKLLLILGKRLTGGQSSRSDHEMPFGPYLAMAALVLLYTWPKLWIGWAGPLFATVSTLVRYSITGEL